MTDEGNAFIAGFFVGLVIVVATTVYYDSHYKSFETIIEAGHGEYSKTTGEFQFLPACNKDK